MNITFIGGGNMATALIGGLVAKGFAPQSIAVVEVFAEARKRLTETFGVKCLERSAAAAPFGDVVVIAVKPQQMREAPASCAAPQGELVLSSPPGSASWISAAGSAATPASRAACRTPRP
jgi:pyrroline-5-carboxylate reductase